jgi:hypothetical protein
LMAESVPDIKIIAVATTLMSISVKMAITMATPRSEWALRFCVRPSLMRSAFFHLLIRVKACRLARQRDRTKLVSLRIGQSGAHHERDIYFTYGRYRLR